MPVVDGPDDDDDHNPRQSYNFAPGYHGVVYRADTPDWGAGSRQHQNGPGEVDEEVFPEATEGQVQYKLQSMTWGLIPFWTKRNPDYGSMMKTINCRDDSLIDNKGMWTSMKQRKRCVVIAQGFYEWLKKGKDKVPHFTKRKDGKLMCFAGLWDCVQYEGQNMHPFLDVLSSLLLTMSMLIGTDERHYTYTIITTDSNQQLRFLHDRMPVILDNGSEDMMTWLDPKRSAWSKELQSLLKPYDGELEVYPVSKEVGKVGNNSPSFMIPITSSENKSNIANFFGKPTVKGGVKHEAKDEHQGLANDNSVTKDPKQEGMAEVKQEKTIKQEESEDRETIDHDGSENHAPLPIPMEEAKQGIKRSLNDIPHEDDFAPPKKATKLFASPGKEALKKVPTAARKSRSATSNNTPSPTKAKANGKEKGSQKITSFFSK
jgi:putative SOS response-associated peptidase YedK